MPAVTVVERDYPNLYKRFTSLGPLMNKLGNGGKGMSWNTDHEVDLLKKLNGTVTEEGASKGLARIDSAIDACEVILSLAPETNGEVAVKAWASLEGFTGRDHTHLAIPKEDEKIRFRDVVAQPRKIISSPIWSGLESREGLLQRRLHQRPRTDPVAHADRPSAALPGPSVDARLRRGLLRLSAADRHQDDQAGDRPQAERQASVVLNFITPHQKWGIHSTYTDNLLMLTLSRGGPIVWISETDAKKAGIVDNDWIEAFNTNGALVARAVVSQRVKQGMCMMYHAQEKIVNVPGSEQTGQRGGIHNSVTRVVLKPTHMIGGYAQQSYGFNYYGTVGSNRDEFVIIRKMSKIDWLDTADRRSTRHCRRQWRPQNENPRSNRDGAEPRQVHRVSHLLASPARTCGPAAKAWNMRGSTTSRPSPASAIRRTGKTRRAGRAAGSASATARSSRGSAANGGCWRTSSPIPICRRSTTITSPSPSTTSICSRRRKCRRCRRRVRAR